MDELDKELLIEGAPSNSVVTVSSQISGCVRAVNGYSSSGTLSIDSVVDISPGSDRINQGFRDNVAYDEYLRFQDGSSDTSAPEFLVNYTLSPVAQLELPYRYEPTLSAQNLSQYFRKYEGRFLILLEKGGPVYG